jgi:NAD(P)-dependent dehydrogenase (short-subunit alcohol dehydrogenase family)
MRRAGDGRIVNVSSIMGLTTAPLTGWYQGAKHALEALSDALRVEVAKDGVRVSLVEPGGFKTGIWQEAQQEMSSRTGSRYESAYRRSLEGVSRVQPIMGSPAQVARTIAAALGARLPRARYLVGYDAQGLALVERVTPTFVKDAVTRLVLGL